MSEKKDVKKNKIKFKPNKSVNLKKNKKWIIFVIIISFIFSVALSGASETVLGRLDIVPSFFILFFIILVGVLSDIVGSAVMASEEEQFHAMASKKVFGAKESVNLIKNANKVSNILNDVVGDMAGIISGTTSVLIVIKATMDMSEPSRYLVSLIVGGTVVSLTIGGKAFGKVFAIRHSDFFVFNTGRLIAIFTSLIYKVKGAGNAR